MNSTLFNITSLLLPKSPRLPEEIEPIYKEIQQLSAAEMAELLEVYAKMLEEASPLAEVPNQGRNCFTQVGAKFARLVTGENARATPDLVLNKVAPTALLKRLYMAIPENENGMRGLALQMLAVQSEPEDLETLVELLEHHPPKKAEGLLIGLSPLFHLLNWPVDSFFPAAFRAIQHQHLAAGIIDLANFTMTKRQLKKHPGDSRRKELIELLGAIVHRLEQFEENPRVFGEDIPTIQDTLRELISLAVSLCYCAGLLGDESAIGKLNQASELRHRHLQAEAFGSLARLGADHGRKELVALAREPAARLRVIEYSKELGLDDMIHPKYMTDEAKAEAKIALWLSEPANYTTPPTKLELIDNRELFWPGYKEAQDIYLFRYHYDLGPLQVCNIAISGPVCFAFRADLADLPIEDIYAAFAGWSFEHPDVHEFDVKTLPSFYSTVLKPLQQRLTDAGHTKIKKLKLGIFFREPILVCETHRGKLKGIAVVSRDEILWFPIRSKKHPMTALEAYCIFKGRIVLRSFNEALGNVWRNSEEFPEPIEEEDE
jgi:hypothetical protein